MPSTRPNWGIVAIGFIVCLLPEIAGCGTSGSQPIPSSEARVVNALVGVSYPGTNTNPDAVNVTTIAAAQQTVVNGNLSFADIPFGAASTYMPAYSGVTTISVVPSGGNIPLISGQQFTIPANTAQTLILVGVLKGTPAPQIVPLTDTFPTFPSSPAPTTAALRIVNLSPDSPPLDLYASTTANAAGMPIAGLTNITYLNASNYAPVSISSSSTLTLTVHNSTTGALIASNTLKLGAILTAGHSYTALLIGMMNPLNIHQEAFDVRILLDN